MSAERVNKAIAYGKALLDPPTPYGFWDGKFPFTPGPAMWANVKTNQPPDPKNQVPNTSCTGLINLMNAAAGVDYRGGTLTYGRDIKNRRTYKPGMQLKRGEVLVAAFGSGDEGHIVMCIESGTNPLTVGSDHTQGGNKPGVNVNYRAQNAHRLFGFEWVGEVPGMGTAAANNPDGGVATEEEQGTFKSSAFDLADLNKLYPLCGPQRAALYHRHLIAAMREFGITTYHRACHFLAQIGWETGQLRYMMELDNEAGTYLRSKEYYPYYGRGAIHLTWRENYERVGKALRVGLADEPDLAAQPQYCFRVAGQYWRTRDLNYFADQGDAGFNAVMARVLGTSDHQSWGGRHALYETAKQVVPTTFDIGGGLVFQTTIFAAAEHEDLELAHRAAIVCHRHALGCTVADSDNILPANDECEPTPVGTFDLELPSIGWLLFLPDSSPNDWIASCPTVVTFATRLLTEPLSCNYHESGGS
jgi:predicted chitinase